jgi:hypothetical protein
VELADGTVVSTLDRAMDLSMFRDSARNVYETAAANYGLAPSLLSHQGVQSADARDLMRIPLRELRLQQQGMFRQFERQFVEVQAMVLARELPELAFDTTGWRIDFADPQTPLGRAEALEIFQKERQLTMTSTVEEMIRRNPDMTREQADTLIKLYVAEEQARIEDLRALSDISGGMSEQMPDPNAGRPVSSETRALDSATPTA